jgi:hypothetical protein
MACITEGSAGDPGLVRTDPVRDRHARRGAQRARLEHLRDRQLAPDACRRGRPVGVEGPLARPRIRALPRLPRRRDEPVVSGPRLRHARAREDGYHLSRDLTDKAIEFIRDSKAVARETPCTGFLVERDIADSGNTEVRRCSAGSSSRSGGSGQAARNGGVHPPATAELPGPRRARAADRAYMSRAALAARTGAAGGAGASGRKPVVTLTARGEEVFDTARDLRRRRKSAVGARVAEPRVGHAREGSVG